MVTRATVFMVMWSAGMVAGCVPVAKSLLTKISPNEAVLNGAVQVAPPRGYCIDKDAGQEQDDTAVVLMGRCINDGKVPAAVVSLTVGAAGSAAALAVGGKGLSDYFTSDDGRAALSLDGDPGHVNVLYASDADGAFVMHLEDRAKGRYWRAVAGAGGRLITISVTPPGGASLDEAIGRAILDEAVQAMQRANS